MFDRLVGGDVRMIPEGWDSWENKTTRCSEDLQLSTDIASLLQRTTTFQTLIEQ